MSAPPQRQKRADCVIELDTDRAALRAGIKAQPSRSARPQRLRRLGPDFRIVQRRFQALDLAPIHIREPKMYVGHGRRRSEEHTSELQSLMRISYAVFCLKKKNTQLNNIRRIYHTTSSTLTRY